MRGQPCPMYPMYLKYRTYRMRLIYCPYFTHPLHK